MSNYKCDSLMMGQRLKDLIYIEKDYQVRIYTSYKHDDKMS